MVKSNLKLNNNSVSVIPGRLSNKGHRQKMTIKRVNAALTILLLISLLVTLLNYYFATLCEMKLNDLNREIVITNDDNFDLQYKLDKVKSFTNIGNKVEGTLFLKKAENVIEIPFKEVSVPKYLKVEKTTKQAWNIGY